MAKTGSHDVAHMILSNMTTYEPPRDKTNKITVRLAKTQISLGIRPVWSVRLMGSQGSSANKMTVRLAKTQINLMGSQGSSASWCGQRRLIRLGGVFAGRTWHFVGFCHEAACMTSVCSFNHGYKCLMMQGLRLVFALLIVLLKYLDSLLVWASSEGSGETARMRRLAWTFAARISDKYQIRLTRSIF